MENNKYILIVTANTNETNALKQDKNFESETCQAENPNDNTFYNVGTYGYYNVVHFELNTQGSVGSSASQLSIANAIDFCHPVAVILVGIAFGMEFYNTEPKQQQIGDVLISDKVADYISGKIKNKKLQSNGSIPESGEQLLSTFKYYSNSWNHKIKNRFAKCEFGLILSGDYVIDDRKFKERLKERFPKAIGGEMEGRGAYAACRSRKITEWIIVKGICDWADGTKGLNKEKNQKIAARSAVSLLNHIFTTKDSLRKLFTVNNEHKSATADDFHNSEIDELDYDDNLFGSINFKDNEYNLLSQIVKLPDILVLVGDGGAGKTTHLKKFCKDLGKNDAIIPIFLSLFNKDSATSILQDIALMYTRNTGITLSEYDLTAFFTRNSHTKFIVILDGLNEYKGNRNNLLIEVNDICESKNVSFIITSRYSCYDYIGIDKDRLKKVKEAQLNHITEQQVSDYLGYEVFLTNYDNKAKDLLTTPFYTSIIKSSGINLKSISEINSSKLMYEYMEHNIKRNKDFEVVLRLVFPYMCYLRYKEESLSETFGEKIGNTTFDTHTITEAIKIFDKNSFFLETPKSENISKMLIDCNLILKRDGLGPVQYSFKHQNIRDTYAALHVANTVYMIANKKISNNAFGHEIDLHAELDDFTQEVFNSIHILCKKDNSQESVLRESKNLVVLQALIKKSTDDIEAKEFANIFVKEYNNPTTNPVLKESLSEMYIVALCIMARNYRRLKCKEVSDLESFKRCLECGLKAKDMYDNNTELNSDGYNHIGKCLNSYMEYLISKGKNAPNDESYPLITMSMESLKYAGTVLLDVIQESDKINSALKLILNSAKDAYYTYYKKDKFDGRVLRILLLNFVSRAYLADACRKNSAESLNLMAMILENDYNVRFRNKIREIFEEDIEQFTTFGENRLDFCYSLYSRASRQPHVVRGYSSMKIASLLIKYEIDSFKDNLDAKRDEIANNLDYAGRANQSMISYWKGRFSYDILSESLDAKKHYEIELHKHLTNGKNPPIKIPIMLVKIELLLFYTLTDNDKMALRNILDSKLSYETLNESSTNLVHGNGELYDDMRYIIMCLNSQKKNLNQDMYADSFWVTEDTVKENLRRFLGNLRTLSGETEVVNS